MDLRNVNTTQKRITNDRTESTRSDALKVQYEFAMSLHDTYRRLPLKAETLSCLKMISYTPLPFTQISSLLFFYRRVPLLLRCQ
jgi:hypothetical protein